MNINRTRRTIHSLIFVFCNPFRSCPWHLRNHRGVWYFLSSDIGWGECRCHPCCWQWSIWHCCTVLYSCISFNERNIILSLFSCIPSRNIRHKNQWVYKILFPLTWHRISICLRFLRVILYDHMRYSQLLGQNFI